MVLDIPGTVIGSGSVEFTVCWLATPRYTYANYAILLILLQVSTLQNTDTPTATFASR